MYLLTNYHLSKTNFTSNSKKITPPAPQLKEVDKPAEMFLSLVRASVMDKNIDTEIFKTASEENWLRMVELADKSSMTGIISDSLSKLPSKSVPVSIKFHIANFANEVEKKYHSQENTLSNISKMLSDKDIETVNLKGLGLSLNYPNPTHRHGRDIDIFTRKKGTVTEGMSNANEILDDIMVGKGIFVEDYKAKDTKHSEFFYNGLFVENHKYFANKEKYKEAKLIDSILHKTLNPTEKILPNGTKILVPSSEFNTVFLAQHAFQHYLGNDMDFHNLTDWATHINKNGLNVPKELKGTNLEKFMYAFTNVANKFMGTNIEVPFDKELSSDIEKAVMEPIREHPTQDMNDLQVFLFKAKRFVNDVKRTKKLTNRSVFSAVFQSVKYHLHHPKTFIRKF